MEFAFFTQQIVRLLLPFIYQDGSYFVNYVDRCTFLCLTVVGGGAEFILQIWEKKALKFI